jgi:hypothetical protein
MKACMEKIYGIVGVIAMAWMTADGTLIMMTVITTTRRTDSE